MTLALAIAVALGVGLGTLLAPTGTAANAAVGTGFLPQPGWTVLQSGADATADRQSLAVASNVALHSEDDARGIRESSGLPYATLLRLPARGVVIVALFTVREPYPWVDEEFPERELPLRVSDAVDSTSYFVQVRPERPLGQYELRARVNGHYVEIHVYFGVPRPSRSLLGVAQRQLDRLVVGSVSASDGAATRAPTAVRAASRVIDRTFACTPMLAFDGGRELDLWASPPRTDPWTIPAYLVARTGTNLPSEDLVYVRARTQGKIGWTSPFPGPAGVYAHTGRCSSARARVPLTSKGLPGPPAGWSSSISCVLRGRVLVRVRALLAAPAEWRRAAGPFRGAQRRVLEASLAVRSERTGVPLAFMTLDRAGRTRLWSSWRCR